MKYYSMVDIAALLGVHPETVAHAIHSGLKTFSGKLPAIRVGRLIKVNEDMLDDWLSKDSTRL